MVPEHLSFSKLFAELTSQKDFFVGVKGVDDQRHQLTDIGGEGEGLDVCGMGRGSWKRKTSVRDFSKQKMRETGNHLWGDGVGWSKKHLVYPVGCGWLGPCSPSKVVLPPSTVLVGASLDMFKVAQSYFQW